MYFVGAVLFGADEAVRQFVAARTPGVREDGVGLGVVRGETLIAGVVFQNYRKQLDIEIVGAADTPTWAWPANMRTICAYPFDQLGVVRVTSIIGRKNKHSRRFTAGLGFKLEGCCRRAIDGKEDAMVYGLLREECRFLKGR